MLCQGERCARQSASWIRQGWWWGQARFYLFIKSHGPVEGCLCEHLYLVATLGNEQHHRRGWNVEQPETGTAWQSGMTPLVAALQTLGLVGEISLKGHWLVLQGDHCQVYVVKAGWGHAFYTWCEDPQERAVQFYDNPITAIQTGLRRATDKKAAGRGAGEAPI